MRSYGNTNAAPYASAPPVGAIGDTYWNTTQKVLYVSDGASWIAGAGAQGPAGPGVPAGGTTGQLLQKSSATDYATVWVTRPKAAWT